MLAFAGQLAADPGSAVWRKLAGDTAQWPLHVPILLARIAYALEVGNWQRGADKAEAKSRAHFPPPILLPGQHMPEEEFDPAAKQVTGQDRDSRARLRVKPRPIEEMKRLLRW